MTGQSIEFLTKATLKTGKESGLKNSQAFPQIKKIVVHIGIGKDRGNQPVIDALITDLHRITGQKPVFRKAKKSIATFKVRAGEPVAIMVTLRGKKMADFLSKLINITLPAIRDFRGVSFSSFDMQGNYSLGVREHSVFPEISFTSSNLSHGLQVTISTVNSNAKLTKQLLDNLGFPFVKESNG